MNINTIDYPNINEKILTAEYKSGLKVFVIPKKGFSKKYISITTQYGSIDNVYLSRNGNSNSPIINPYGTAHFLEHMLFEQRTRLLFDNCFTNGIYPKAYTTFNHTSFFFSCRTNVESNLKLLLDLIQNLSLNDQNIEIERNVIRHEIKMHSDNPQWVSLYNLLGSFYNSPIAIDIAGTEGSILGIDKEILNRNYNAYYNHNNMFILVVGDINEEAVFKTVEDNINKNQCNISIERVYSDRDSGIKRNYVNQKLALSKSIFTMGFKDIVPYDNSLESIRRELAVKIIFELILGKSSNFYNDLFNEGLIKSQLNSDYVYEKQYSYSQISCESTSPEKVRDLFFEHIKKINSVGIYKTNLLTVKKSSIGNFIKSLDSLEKLIAAFICVYLKGYFIFDYLDLYNSISVDYLNKIFYEHFNINNFALSVITPR